MQYRLVRFSIILFVCCSLPSAQTGCARVPELGRRQLMLVSSDREERLGLRAYQAVLEDSELSTDQHMTELVGIVGRRIAAVSHQPDMEWEFALIESEEVNAFCLPGGKVAVYTGILPVMANEAGMAAILGHEVAHAVARHGGERMSQRMTLSAIKEALSYGLPFSGWAASGVMTAFGLGTEVGVLLPYSRTHEKEADKLGLLYAARAGYDPREAVNFWERMRKAKGDQGVEFLSTHPSKEHRVEDLQEFMPAALESYNKAPQQYGLGESW